MLLKTFLKRIFNEMGMCSQHNVEWKKAGYNPEYDFKGVSKRQWKKTHQNVNRVKIWIVGLWVTFTSFIFSVFPAINNITYNENSQNHNYF